jgi:hypothetical protein
MPIGFFLGAVDLSSCRPSQLTPLIGGVVARPFALRGVVLEDAGVVMTEKKSVNSLGVLRMSLARLGLLCWPVGFPQLAARVTRIHLSEIPKPNADRPESERGSLGISQQAQRLLGTQ